MKIFSYSLYLCAWCGKLNFDRGDNNICLDCVKLMKNTNEMPYNP